MPKRKNLNHKYLLSLYARVDDFLSNDNIPPEDLPDSIVSFCIVTEKTLKLKLHSKNPLLVFDATNLKTDDAISIVALKKEKDIETARIQTILSRFGIIFKKFFTPDEIQALRDIYEVRNCFVHGYKQDNEIAFDSEDVVKKMGTVWGKISKIAIDLFGKENIKNGRPKKKYSEKELEKVLEDEVKKMIKPLANRYGLDTLNDYIDVGRSVTSIWRHDECPRCHAPYFSLEGNKNEWGSSTDWSDTLYTATPWRERSALYKCKKCNLELTEKQYEIAKKIIDGNRDLG